MNAVEVLRPIIMCMLQSVALQVHSIMRTCENNVTLHEMLPMLYGLITNIGNQYKALVPTAIVGDNFDKEYNNVAMLCKACSNFKGKYDSHKERDLYNCSKCLNFTMANKNIRIAEIFNCKLYKSCGRELLRKVGG